MTSVCTSLKAFNMTAYVKANLELSIVSYLWKPVESAPLKSYRRYPATQNAAQIKRLKALHAWAERTDPGSLIRNEYQRMLWEGREPGQAVVTVR